MTREEYHNIKRHIKSLCIDSVLELSKRVGLNEYETKLLEHINKNDTRTCMSFKLNICESKITKDIRKTFTKIHDYNKRQI